VVYGKTPEQVAETVNAGDLVAIDGKLGWMSRIDKKTKEISGKLTVLAWSVQVEQVSTPMPTPARAVESRS
jgi:single-stranded DNA-binding protein